MLSRLLAPAFDFETCIVFDDFGRSGFIGTPAVRVVTLDTAEGWSRDNTEDIAREFVERAASVAEPFSDRHCEYSEWITLGC
jgi:hypothetical protein